MVPLSRPPTTSLRADAVTVLARQHASRSDRERGLPAELTSAIREAGFARHFVPARWAGREGGFQEFVEAVADLGRVDPSAAWCASIVATFGRMAGYLPEEAQRRVWRDGPDAVIVGAQVPAGSAVPGAGGWRVSGRWPYVSGVRASDWALLACLVPSPRRRRSQARFLLVPRAAYRIEDTWHTVGMRGTGSETLVLDPTFVPARHSFARADLLVGRHPGSAPACLAAPLRTVNALTFAAPVLGAVRGAVESCFVASGHRAEIDATAVMALARGAAEVDAAALLLARSASDADRGLIRDKWVGARAQRDQLLAVDLLIGAVSRLPVRAGSYGRDDDVQRFWRDAYAGAGHAVLRWEPVARRFAAVGLARLRISQPERSSPRSR